MVSGRVQRSVLMRRFSILLLLLLCAGVIHAQTALPGPLQQVVMPFSAQPRFDTTQANIFLMQLSGNVTSSQILGGIAGQQITFLFTQDNAGGHTFAWPANTSGAPNVDTTANATTSAVFLYDGRMWNNAKSSGATPGGSSGQIQINNGSGGLGGAGVLPNPYYSTSGIPEFAFQCVGNATTDTASLNTAIAAAKATGYGGRVIPSGPGGCALNQTNLDGQQIGAPIIIDFQTGVCLNGTLHFGVNGPAQGWSLVSTTRGSAGQAPSFGHSGAQIGACTGAVQNPLVEIDGAQSITIDNLAFIGASGGGLNDVIEVTTSTASWCGGPPCGSTQIVISNDVVQNLSGGYAVGFREGGMPNGIVGFDAWMPGNTLSTNSVTHGELYVQDFGGLRTDYGRKSWYEGNGGSFITLACSVEESCGDYHFNNIDTESSFVSVQDAVIATGTFGSGIIEFDDFAPSDSGAPYVFSISGGSATLQFGNILFDGGFLDPTSVGVSLTSTSQRDSTLTGNIANPRCLNCLAWNPPLTQAGSVSTVRFANSFPNSGTSPYTGCSSGGCTVTNVTDPLGGNSAYRVTTSVASSPFFVANQAGATTPSVGDVIVAVIALRSKDYTVAANINNDITYVGGGTTALGQDFKSIKPGSNWSYLISLKRVTASSGTNFLEWAMSSDNTAETFDVAFPYWTVIPAATASALGDLEIMNWAQNLFPVSGNCTAQEVCTVYGPARTSGGALESYIGGFRGIFSHGNTADRTYTFPDANINVAGLNLAQTFSATQTFGTIIPNQVNLPEGSAPSGESATDVLYGLSSSHWPAFNPNNAGARVLCGSTGSFTSGHIVAANTTGTTCDLVDGGTGTGSGTVTNFSASTITTGSQNFATAAVTSPGVTPNLTYTLVNVGAGHKFFGNNTGSAATPDYESIGEADLPNTTVFTDNANTFGAHLNDFSAATIKVPSAAGFTASASSMFGLDSSTGYFHGYQNSNDRLFVLATNIGTSNQYCASNANGTCTYTNVPSGVTIQTNGVNNTSQALLNFNTPTGGGAVACNNPSGGSEQCSEANTFGGGNATPNCTATGSLAQTYLGGNGSGNCVNVQIGVTESGTTTCNGHTILQSELGQPIYCTDGSAAAVTLNGPGSYTANFYFCLTAKGAGTVTVTATGNVDGASTIAIVTKNTACFDNNGTTWQTRRSTGF